MSPLRGHLWGGFCHPGLHEQKWGVKNHQQIEVIFISLSYLQYFLSLASLIMLVLESPALSSCQDFIKQNLMLGYT